jgi:hypothetical protein
MAQDNKVDRDQLIKEIRKCIPCEPERKKAPEASAAQAIEVAAFELGNNIQTYAVALAAIAAIIVIIRSIGLVIPGLVLVAARIGIQQIIIRLGAVQARLAAQQAANQSAYTIVRHTAANEAFYARLANAGL